MDNAGKGSTPLIHITGEVSEREATDSVIASRN